MNIVSTLIYSRHPGVRFLRHIVFWITDIASYLSVISINREINSVEVLSIVLKIIPIACVTYLILYFLIPSFSISKPRGRYFFWIAGILIFIGVGMRLYGYYFVNPLLGVANETAFQLWDFRLAIGTIFSYMAVICMAITIKLVKNKTELELTNQQLKDEKRVAELNFLKAQMQPHFLFNTLNTLYAETIQESGKGQQIVLHLSNLLRFILTECNKPMITIEKEILVIKDFIALEKFRHGDRLDIQLRINRIDPGAMISPLVFLPFIENSFKHTLTRQRGIIRIDIEIGMDGDHFYLHVENDKVPELIQLNGHQPGKGIGNIRKQLDLLYGDAYRLSINGSVDKYHVSLFIPIKSSFVHV